MEGSGEWKNKAKAKGKKAKAKGKKTKQKVKSAGGLNNPEAPSAQQASSAPPQHHTGPLDVRLRQSWMTSPTTMSPPQWPTAPPPQNSVLAEPRIRQPLLGSPSAPAPPQPSVGPPRSSGLLRVRQPEFHGPNVLPPPQHTTYATYQTRPGVVTQTRAPIEFEGPDFRTLDSFLDSENTSQSVRERYNNLAPHERQVFDPIY